MGSLTQLLFSNKEEDHEAFVEKLRSIVIGELRERNLFNVSPKYLGYAGGSWQADDGDRINDLVMDIYEAILRRRTTLRTHLKKRPDLDGMIRRNVRNLFHDRQHQHDPIGFGVFHNVVGGLERAVAGGALATADTEIKTGSLLQYSSWTQYSSAAGEDAMKAAVLGQGRETELITRLATVSEEAQTDLEQRVTKVPAVDPSIECFHCRDLANPLKAEVRATAVALVAHQEIASDIDDSNGSSQRTTMVPVVTLGPGTQLLVTAAKNRIETSSFSTRMKQDLAIELEPPGHAAIARSRIAAPGASTVMDARRRDGFRCRRQSLRRGSEGGGHGGKWL